jgi:hypothetical protein
MAPAPGRIAKRGQQVVGGPLLASFGARDSRWRGASADEDVRTGARHVGRCALTRFYEQLLGWGIEAQEGPRPGYPEADGWSRLRPADGSDKIEIQYEQHYEPPTWPGEPGKPGMQIHLDIWVEDLQAGIEWAQTCGAVQSEKQPDGRDLSRLRVMIDPAGHPFCLWT